MLIVCVGDKFEIFMTEVSDFSFEKVINIMILPATRCQHLQTVTVIKSPTSLSPNTDFGDIKYW